MQINNNDPYQEFQPIWGTLPSPLLSDRAGKIKHATTAKIRKQDVEGILLDRVLGLLAKLKHAVKRQTSANRKPAGGKILRMLWKI